MPTLFDEQVRTVLRDGPKTMKQIAEASGLDIWLAIEVVHQMIRDGAVVMIMANWRACGEYEYELVAERAR